MVYRRDTEFAGYRRTTSEDILARGSTRVADIAAAVEDATGATLEGRHALDFGCGVGRIAVPLAERCEHVYALDIAPAMLQEAQANAARMNVTNLEALPAERLGELAGRYDFLVSLHVLQHIPRAAGERTFAALLSGLSPGGVGFVNLILRPPHPLAHLLRFIWRSPAQAHVKRLSNRLSPARLVRVLDLSYAYMMRRSYSLDRLGRLMADAGIDTWQVHYNAGASPRAFDAVALIFRKP